MHKNDPILTLKKTKQNQTSCNLQSVNWINFDKYIFLETKIEKNFHLNLKFFKLN